MTPRGFVRKVIRLTVSGNRHTRDVREAVVQATQERDAMNRALRAERSARYTMESAVRTLRRDSVGAALDTIVGVTGTHRCR